MKFQIPYFLKNVPKKTPTIFQISDFSNKSGPLSSTS